MSTKEITVNQKRLRVVSIVSLLISILMVVLAIMFFAFFGAMNTALVQDAIADGSLEFSSMDAAETEAIFFRLSGYFLFVGLSLQIASIYGIRASLNAIVAVRMRYSTAIAVAASVVGVVWTGWLNFSSPFLIVTYLAVIAAEVGMLQLAQRIQGEVTGATAEAVERERIRKSLPREERLADANHLGFLRFVQVYFALNIIFTLIGLIFASRNEITYNYTTLLDWANVIFECVAFYLLVNRARIAKRWVIGYSLFNIAANVIHAVGLYAMGKADLFTSIVAITLSLIGDGIIIAYFLRSDRVRILMTNELSNEVSSDALAETRHGKTFVRNLLLYYCIFSTLGHWMEAGFCYLVSLGLFQGDIDFGNTMLFRDWLYPFPMHGIAVVLVALILWPLKNTLSRHLNRWATLLTSFLVNMLFCTCIEFAGGMMFNRNLQLWNYSDIPFNFMGQVCLQNAVVFGVAATLIVYVVYPYLETLISRVPTDIMNVVSVGIFAFYAILTTLYVIDVSPEAAAANAKVIMLMLPLLH